VALDAVMMRSERANLIGKEDNMKHASWSVPLCLSLLLFLAVSAPAAALPAAAQIAMAQTSVRIV
jgi:hypothetical protein